MILSTGLMTLAAAEGTKAAAPLAAKAAQWAGAMLATTAGAYLTSRARESGKQAVIVREAPHTLKMELARGIMDVGFAAAKEFSVGKVRAYLKQQDRINHAALQQSAS